MFYPSIAEEDEYHQVLASTVVTYSEVRQGYLIILGKHFYGCISLERLHKLFLLK